MHMPTFVVVDVYFCYDRKALRTDEQFIPVHTKIVPVRMSLGFQSAPEGHVFMLGAHVLANLPVGILRRQDDTYYMHPTMTTPANRVVVRIPACNEWLRVVPPFLQPVHPPCPEDIELSP